MLSRNDQWLYWYSTTCAIFSNSHDLMIHLKLYITSTAYLHFQSSVENEWVGTICEVLKMKSCISSYPHASLFYRWHLVTPLSEIPVVSLSFHNGKSFYCINCGKFVYAIYQRPYNSCFYQLFFCWYFFHFWIHDVRTDQNSLFMYHIFYASLDCYVSF